jgi:hypothetical protein
MSFLASCAINDPSTYSTKECTHDCGWITTSICSAGTSNRNRASMISSPLFIIVAESIVILGPIFQVGCASASSTVISGTSRGRARGTDRPSGQDEARDSPSALRCAAPGGWRSARNRRARSRRRARAPCASSARRDDQSLLVREREPLSRHGGGVRGAEAERADEPSDDDVRRRVRGDLLESAGCRRRCAGRPPRAGAPKAGTLPRVRTRTRSRADAARSVRPAARPSARRREPRPRSDRAGPRRRREPSNRSIPWNRGPRGVS